MPDTRPLAECAITRSLSRPRLAINPVSGIRSGMFVPGTDALAHQPLADEQQAHQQIGDQSVVGSPDAVRGPHRGGERDAAVDDEEQAPDLGDRSRVGDRFRGKFGSRSRAMRSMTLGGWRRLRPNTLSITAFTSNGYSFSGNTWLAMALAITRISAPPAAASQTGSRLIAARAVTMTSRNNAR